MHVYLTLEFHTNSVSHTVTACGTVTVSKCTTNINVFMSVAVLAYTVAKQTSTSHVVKQDSLNGPQLPNPAHTQFFVHTSNTDTSCSNDSISLPNISSNFQIP